MAKQIIQNNITKDQLCEKATSETSVEKNLASLEYQLDTLSKLVSSLIKDINKSDMKLSKSTTDRLKDINQFLTQSSIDFDNLKSNDENWKISHAIITKEKQRKIQKWYQTAKKRIFGSN